jgi:hypothetical protein
MQRGPRPGGTLEVMVRDICRRNGVDAALETLAILLKGVLAFVPQGQADRSLARSAWVNTTLKEPSRRVRCDSRGCAR